MYIELPTEIAEPGKCGRLLKSLYGTRDAAQNWEVEYSRFMESVGFSRGTSTPRSFYNQEKELRVVAHGDDFTVLGWEHQLNWFLEKIRGVYEIKQSRIGPAPADKKAVRILNRVLQWTDFGLDWEADQRHSELITRHCNLGDKPKAVSTPGGKRDFEDREGSPDLTHEEAFRFRAIVAIGNYLAQDRTDVQYAV